MPKRKSFRLVTVGDNQHSLVKIFRNENIDDVLEAVNPTDQLVTFDIEDGFFNVRIRPEHSKYLAFR